MIEDIVNSVKIARDSKAYLAALALALTLPDVCSRIEKQRKTTGEDYKEWFNTWVSAYFRLPNSDNEAIQRGIEFTTIDGNICYNLRCALLHAGNTNLEKTKVTKFELSLCDGISCVCDVTTDNPNYIYICVNVITLIDGILWGAYNFLHQNEEKISAYEAQEENDALFGSIHISDT